MKPDFKKVEAHDWWAIDDKYNKSGVYLICFKSKNYLGKTVNFARRLREHFRACFKQSGDWHWLAREDFTLRFLPARPSDVDMEFNP